MEKQEIYEPRFAREFWERAVLAAMSSGHVPAADWADRLTEEWRKRFDPEKSV